MFISTTGFFFLLTDRNLIELCFVIERLLDPYPTMLIHTGGGRARTYGGETTNENGTAHRGRGKRAAPQFRSISRPNIPVVISSFFEIVG